MSRSSRLRSDILNNKENLWKNDSESDTSSSFSDNEKKKHGEISSDENSQPTCCLICSILPNLSNVNTCQKHLNLINTTKTPTQVVYVVHSPINNCHCRTKSKHRCRSISSSSSESENRHQTKKRSMTIQSSNPSSQDDVFFSPKVQSQTTQSNPVHARLSPSLPPSSTINTNKHYPEPLLTPFLQQNNTEILKTSSPDVVEVNSELSSSSSIEIIHVKDENESFSDNNSQKRTTINMAEATEQMFNNQYPQPIILLKRIRLEELR